MIHDAFKRRPLSCDFYRTHAGNEPVRDWLKKLPKGERHLIGIDIQAVQFGWPLGLPLVDSLGNGLWEIRTGLPSRIARIIFFVESETIIPLHGFIKKTRSTSIHDLRIARKRKQQYEEIKKSASRQ